MGKSIKNLSSVTIIGLDIAKNVFQVTVHLISGLRLRPPVSAGSICGSAAPSGIRERQVTNSYKIAQWRAPVDEDGRYSFAVAL